MSSTKHEDLAAVAAGSNTQIGAGISTTDSKSPSALKEEDGGKKGDCREREEGRGRAEQEESLIEASTSPSQQQQKTVNRNLNYEITNV